MSQPVDFKQIKIVSWNTANGILLASMVAPLPWAALFLVGGGAGLFILAMIIGFAVSLAASLTIGLTFFLLAERYHERRYWVYAAGGIITAIMAAAILNQLAISDTAFYAAMGVSGFICASTFWLYVIREAKNV